MGTKGKGTLYKYKGLYYFQLQVNGKRKIFPLQTGSKEEAERKAEEKRKAFASENIEQLALFVANAKQIINSDVPVADVWKLYLASPARPDSGEGTLSNYQTQWAAFKNWIGSAHPEVVHFAEIAQSHADEYARLLWDERKLSSSTFNQHIKTLRLITRIVGKDSTLRNAWNEVKLKTEIKQGRDAFSQKDIVKILAWFDSDVEFRCKDEYKLLFYIGAHTGLRLESAINLTWRNIDLIHDKISCMPKKTIKTQRVVKIPLHPALKAELEKLPSRSGDLTPRLKLANSNPKDRRVSKDVIAILEACGFKERNRPESKDDSEERGVNRRLYGFHSFRHAYASACANAGVPITTLAEILGDSIATLQRYYMHAQDESKTKIFAALSPSAPTAKDKLVEEIGGLLKAAGEPTLRKVKKLLQETPESGPAPTRRRRSSRKG